MALISIMNLTKESAIEIGLKVMNDIEYDWWDKEDENGPRAIFIDSKTNPLDDEEYWIVAFPYGKEDYGENIEYLIRVNNDSKIAINIVYRNGFIKLGFGETSEKYYISERRP